MFSRISSKKTQIWLVSNHHLIYAQNGSLYKIHMNHEHRRAMPVVVKPSSSEGIPHYYLFFIRLTLFAEKSASGECIALLHSKQNRASCLKLVNCFWQSIFSERFDSAIILFHQNFNVVLVVNVMSWQLI